MNNKEVLKHLKEYLLEKIDNGEHKIIFNDLMWDEKTIDCYNAIDEVLVEIERLTELCNKYEEEHKTTFETWQKDIKEIERLKIQVSARETEYERLHSIIKEVREMRNYLSNKYYEMGEEVDMGVIIEHLDRILDKVGEE